MHCMYCKREFSPNQGRGRPRKFCSKNCGLRFYRKQPDIIWKIVHDPFTNQAGYMVGSQEFYDNWIRGIWKRGTVVESQGRRLVVMGKVLVSKLQTFSVNEWGELQRI